MDNRRSEIEILVAAYLAPDRIVKELGAGIDGIVYSSSRATAVKAHHSHRVFTNELKVYQRLDECRVDVVCGFAVPRLMGFCTNRQLIEMSIVRPPFILDFAQSTLDGPPDFDADIMDEFFRKMREDFEDKWPVAQEIYETLRRRHGIYHLDLKPRNVHFGGRDGQAASD